MPRHPNFLLSQLDAVDWSTIEPCLSVVPLVRLNNVAHPRERIDRVYFPHSGILSFMVDLPEGHAIETAMLGRDGVFGATQALDDRVSLNRVMVQVPGEASVIGARDFCAIALATPAFRRLILAYEQFFFACVQQTCACNAVHNVRQRCCRWLLRMTSLVGDELDLTQEFLSQMMGVRRTSISAIARDLQNAGLIRYHRGHITIRDLAAIRATACGCEGDIGQHFDRMFDNQVSPRAIA